MRQFLMAVVGSIVLVGCHSETEKPSGSIDEIAMRDRDQNERPNMVDLRQDAMQEARTQGRACNGNDCDQGYQPY
jgi:hypothetical protein